MSEPEENQNNNSPQTRSGFFKMDELVQLSGASGGIFLLIHFLYFICTEILRLNLSSDSDYSFFHNVAALTLSLIFIILFKILTRKKRNARVFFLAFVNWALLFLTIHGGQTLISGNASSEGVQESNMLYFINTRPWIKPIVLVDRIHSQQKEITVLKERLSEYESISGRDEKRDNTGNSISQQELEKILLEKENECKQRLNENAVRWRIDSINLISNYQSVLFAYRDCQNQKEATEAQLRKCISAPAPNPYLCEIRIKELETENRKLQSYILEKEKELNTCNRRYSELEAKCLGDSRSPNDLPRRN